MSTQFGGSGVCVQVVHGHLCPIREQRFTLGSTALAAVNAVRNVARTNPSPSTRPYPVDAINFRVGVAHEGLLLLFIRTLRRPIPELHPLLCARRPPHSQKNGPLWAQKARARDSARESSLNLS